MLFIILLDRIPKIGQVISSLFIFTFFLFAIPNLENLTQAIFYSIMGLAVIVFKLFAFGVEDKQAVLGYKGWGLTFISVIIGVGIFIIMTIMQKQTTNAIIGTPKLLAVAGLSNLLGPAQIASLGYIENRFFFSWFNVLRLPIILPILMGIIGPFALLLPYIAIGMMFSIFHLSAFALSVGSLMWAFIVFNLWMVSAYALKLGDEPSCISHFLWNGFVVLKRQYAIILPGGGL